MMLFMEKRKVGCSRNGYVFEIMKDKMLGGNGMIFADFLKVRYGNKNIDDVTRKRRYYEWVAQNYDFNIKSRKATKYADPYDFHHEYPYLYIPQESDSPPNDTLRINTYFFDVFQTQLKKPRLRDNSFEEWVKIKLGHTNISEAIKCEMFKEWVKENFNFKVDFGKTRDDPYSRRFDVYKEKFDTEIEPLENEYDLRVGMKKYALDDIWEKCERFQDEGFEEEEQWESSIEKTCYAPPFVKSETFEVKRYSFKNKKSFMRITKQLDDAQPLGRVNGSRFIGMIRKEMDEEGKTTRKT
ncbi:hypothetical protein Tco_0846342 [Tanacetum coccineum]